MEDVSAMEPISSLWDGSVLEIHRQAVEAAALPDYLPIVAALLALAFLAFFKQIIYGVGTSAILLFAHGSHSKISGGVSFNRAADITATLCVPLAAVCLVFSGISSLSIFQTTAVAAGYVLLQVISTPMARYFSQTSDSSDDDCQPRSIFIVSTTLCLPFAIVSLAFPETCAPLARICICLIAGAAAIYHFVSNVALIKKLGFSFVFSFLYLCILQLLPLAATVKILL